LELLTCVFRVGPVRWYRWVGYSPGDVPDEQFVDRIVGEAVSEVHGDVRQEGGHGELGPHAAICESFFGTGVVLDDVPPPHHLQQATLDSSRFERTK
jgi:hypothetical protein